MTVCGERRSTFGETAERTRRLANFLAGNGFGAHRERDELENWECGQDRVALIMHNDLYPDMVIGCLKARTVPVNVNYNYTPREVAELLDYLRPAGRHLPPVAWRRSSPTCCRPPQRDLLISVDDGSDGAGTARGDQAGRCAGPRGYGSRRHTLARRCDDGVHRRNHGTSQGCACGVRATSTSCR